MSEESPKAIEQTREQHDTRIIERAMQAGHLDGLTEEARDRQYCIECSRSVREGEYDWKYIGVGGFLSGPFCGRACQLRWLSDG